MYKYNIHNINISRSYKLGKMKLEKSLLEIIKFGKNGLGKMTFNHVMYTFIKINSLITIISNF